MAGEYTTQVMREGLREFLRRNRPESLQTHPAVAADAAAASTGQPRSSKSRAPGPPNPSSSPSPSTSMSRGWRRPRPAGFCTGCPERPIFRR